MNKTNEVLAGLKQALNDESTVLFIGSGVSVWSGLPRWDKLLLDLAATPDASRTKLVAKKP